MPRALRPIVVLLVVACAPVVPVLLAHAEQGGARVIVLPLRGPGGVIARNEIADAIEPHLSYVRKIGAKGAQRPARTARMHKADAMIGGRVRCPGQRCIVDVLVYRRSGQLWTKGTKRTTRARIGEAAADLCRSLLDDIGLGSGGGDDDGYEPVDDDRRRDDDYRDDDRRRDDDYRDDDRRRDDDYDDDRRRDDDDYRDDRRRRRDDDDYEDDRRRRRDDEDYDDDRRRDDDDRDRRRRDDDDDYDDEFDMDDFDEDGDEDHGRRRRGGSEHDFDALEVYFNADLTLARNLCVDLDPELQNDAVCDLREPTVDDRTYTVSPFVNLGFRLALFPGAFFRRRAWWSHFGLWADYGHSISVTSQREYETAEEPIETYTVEIPTVQQDFRIGLMYRLAIPYNEPTGVQLRFMVGFGFYQFKLDDTAYPQDHEIRLRYRDSNPYLPSFEYSSIDVGLNLRIPIRGFIFPYTSLFYRATLGAGQAERIYGDQSSINGIDWELAVAIELGYGIRIQAGIELIWYQTAFAGEFAPESEEEALIWGGDIIAGDTSTDLVFRLRLGVGWAF